MEENIKKDIYERYTLRDWCSKYKNGEFDARSIEVSIYAGAYDWWKDTSMLSWVKKYGKKILEIASSPMIDPDKTYVFYKEICPMVGPTYDRFSICNIETDDILYSFSKLKKGCYGKDFSGWEVTTIIGDYFGENKIGDWRNVKKYMNIQ